MPRHSRKERTRDGRVEGGVGGVGGVGWGVVLDPFDETLAKFIALVLVGLALSLRNLHFV